MNPSTSKYGLLLLALANFGVTGVVPFGGELPGQLRMEKSIDKENQLTPDLNLGEPQLFDQGKEN
jgi:hypothetical protein